MVKQVGTALAIGALLFLYASGDWPTIARKVRLNVPRLEKPTSKQMPVTLRSVSRKRNIERSTRRRCRYRCGVSPNVARKVRMKCASETQAIRASVGTSSGSAYVRSIASRARSMRRLRSSVARLTRPSLTRGGQPHRSQHANQLLLRGF